MNTKNIQLFGIGNALVDVQLQLSDADFDALGLRKGTMALVDAATQRGLLERFLHLPANKCSGGSAANTIIAFAGLGGRAAYGTLLGSDEHGQFFRREFDKLGIELFADLHESEQTGTCLVFITPDTERTMHTSLAVNSRYSREHITEDAIKRSEWLYIEGYKYSENSGAEAIEHAVFYAKKHGTRIAVTFSDVFIVENFKDELRKTIAHADLVFANEMETGAFIGSDNYDEAFRAMREHVPNYAMTLGVNGSRVYYGQSEYHIPVYAGTAVDSTGAGDMYAAGFLYGITHKHTPEIAGHIGSRAAARVVSQLGARLNDEEFGRLRAEMFAA